MSISLIVGEKEEVKVIKEGAHLGKCIWVKRKASFFEYHAHLKPIKVKERKLVLAGEAPIELVYQYKLSERARGYYFAYKKREHERRRRLEKRIKITSVGIENDKKLINMHRCEGCHDLFDHVNLFWGLTLCNICYHNPTVILYIMSIKFGDILELSKAYNIVQAPALNNQNVNNSNHLTEGVTKMVISSEEKDKEVRISSVHCKKRKLVVGDSDVGAKKEDMGDGSKVKKVQLSLQKFYNETKKQDGEKEEKNIQIQSQQHHSEEEECVTPLSISTDDEEMLKIFDEISESANDNSDSTFAYQELYGMPFTPSY